MSYRYCSACAKYVLKKNYKSHMKSCDNCQLNGNVNNSENPEEEWEARAKSMILPVPEERVWAAPMGAMHWACSWATHAALTGSRGSAFQSPNVPSKRSGNHFNIDVFQN